MDFDPSYIPHSLVILDSIFFISLLCIALLVLYFFSRKYKFSPALTLLLFIYVIFSYSSYNIMVMPIHDFNLPIARTFVYHFKIFSVFSFTDIFFLIVFTVFFVQWLTRKKSDPSFIFSSSAPLLRLAAIQGGVIFSISLLGYAFYTSSGGIGSVKNQLLYARGIVYFSAMLLVFYRASKGVGKVEFASLLFVFCVLDFINFISGFIGTYIYTDYVWERYGVKVSIIDQDKIYNYFTLYLFVFISMFFANKKRISLSLILMVIMAVCMLLNIYKFLFAIAAIYLVYDIFVRLVTHRLPIKRFILLLIVALALVHPAVKIFTSKAINTRASQLNDYWTYTGKYFPANIIGIGHGGLYLSPTGVADKGEIKRIDMDANGEVEYKRSIQTPLLTQIKNSGILGMLVMLITASFAFCYILLINIKLSSCEYATPLCFNLIWLIGFVCVAVQPYPMPVLTLIKLMMLMGALLMYKKSEAPESPVLVNH
ncbi:hypothetical protein [Serratia entomophila]|uniref:hypothetical protein n=1 Tax=Serratia entomophila TaxID=42906 RepID=UPI00217769E3|nr:hypothetical protein [Serratia entomophila]CAI1121791.1 Uncharacterised protein [Serratia entomophila]CAI1832838.1 Uncharacterised protein [Serratia entomophila]CAI1854073.1 Uncharacterised protein [Serratia entomophila]CAI1902200.1 Uncharacterised protein [Serratia entomophila]CAI1934455.1 Uncharacterised protein [Serratia entomophila]